MRSTEFALPGLHTAWASVVEDPGHLSRHAASTLHPKEQSRYETFRSPSRRATFIAGRVAAKQVLTSLTRCEPREILVRSWDRNGRGARPTVWTGQDRLSGTLTLTHDDRHAFAGWSPQPGTFVGVDLIDREQAMSPSPLFFSDFERRWLAEHAFPPAYLFGAKEAVFKASLAGEFRPLEVQLQRSGASSADSFLVSFPLTCPTGTSVLAVATRGVHDHSPHIPPVLSFRLFERAT